MSRDKYNKLSHDELDFVDDKTAALILNTPTSARAMLWVIILFFIAAVIWAAWAKIDKVTVGQGKVIPSSQVQIVQNLEGGLIKEILVKEGQQVAKGQPLLLIDDTRFRSDFREREQQVANLTALVIQLSASIDSVEVNRNFKSRNWEKSVILHENKLIFPTDLEENQPRLTQRQKAEYRENLHNLRNKLSVIDQQVKQKQQDLVEIQARVNNLRQSYRFAKKELENNDNLHRKIL